MKKSINYFSCGSKLPLLIYMCCLSSIMGAYATVRTVNNAVIPVNPGQYANISDAISASSAGDTILVAGSLTPYNDGGGSGYVHINKRVVLIGAGYNPKGATPATKINQAILVYCSASGSKIMGFEFQQSFNFFASGGTNHNNISVLRNYFSSPGVIGLNTDSVMNCLFANNVFGYDVSVNTVTSSSGAYQTTNLNFLNNIFGYPKTNSYSIRIHSTTYNSVNIDHNLFLFNRGIGSSALDTLANGSGLYAIKIENTYGTYPSYNVVSNNIFWGCNAVSINGGSAPMTFFAFYNNISYGYSALTALPLGGTANIGSGNLNNTHPRMQYTNPFNVGIGIDIASMNNFKLASWSPCINAGSDGTNIGPTGGAYPIFNTNSGYLTGEPPIPSVRTATVTGSATVPAGTPLNMTISGKKIN